MGHLQRIIVSASVLFSDLIGAVLYARAGMPLIEMAETGGQFDGPMSSAIDLLAYVAPVAFAIIALAALLYPVVGAVQQETAGMQQARMRP